MSGPHIRYINMGAWPVFVGLTTSPKDFAKELKRLGIGPVPFLARPGANASLHNLVDSSGGQIYILAIEGFKKSKVSRESYAGLVAHEAMHIIQYMQADLANDRSLGIEAEAYLIQQIVQEMLQEAWDSKLERRTEPVPDE